MALADTAALIVQLKLDDKLSGPLNRVSGSLRGFGAGVGQVGKGVGQVGVGLLRIGTVAATGFAVGVGTAVKVAGDFEAQLNTINTIAKLSDTQLTTLGSGIRETFRETGVPLEELTSAYYDLLSAGVKVTDAQGVLNTAVKLGIGGLATTKESVDLLTTAINAYGLDASGAASASDIFAATVRDGKVVISELNASFADVAPLAAQAGVNLEEIGAAYATLTARGVPATEVGTQFNRAIIELLKPGPDLVKILKGLGISSFEASIKQKGLVQTLEDVRLEAEKQGIPFQDLFGRLEAYKFALATTGPNQEKFNAELAAMGNAAGETEAQFAERQQGLNFQIAKLKALAQDAGITIGNALLPKLVPLVDELNTFIQNNQGKIADFGQKLADGLSSFADRLKTTDFSGVIGGLKLLRDVGKEVVDIFLSLPPGVQSALITGVALNKLSGGLLGQGAGNIAGGILKIVFQRGSTPANPLWVQSIGGIGGGVPGGLTGGGLSIVKFLGLAAAGGLGAVLGSEIGHALVDPQIRPAVNFETSAFERALRASADDPKILANNIRAIKEGLADFNVGTGQPLQEAVARLLFGDQIKILEDQLAQLEALRGDVGNLKTTGSRVSEAAEAATRGRNNAAMAAESRAAAARERMIAYHRQQAGGIDRIAAKKTSFSATVNVAATANISVSNVARALTSYRIAGTTTVGGLMASDY